MLINAKGVSAIGYRLLAIGYRLLAIGYWLSVIGYRLLDIGDRQAIEKDEGCPRLFSYLEPLASRL